MIETENDVEVVHKCILSRDPRHLGIFSPFLREPTTSTCALKLPELSLWHTPIARSVSTLKLCRSFLRRSKHKHCNLITETAPRSVTVRQCIHDGHSRKKDNFHPRGQVVASPHAIQSDMLFELMNCLFLGFFHLIFSDNVS